MPRPKRGPRLGGSPTHQKHILSNLATDLFWEERVTTTVTKAKVLRPYAEKIITKARTERPGGYTRLVRIGPRRGDGAEMAIVELV